MVNNKSEAVKKLHSALHEATAEFFVQNRSNLEYDCILNDLFDHLARVIFCMMDEDIRVDPNKAAKKMGEILESRILSTAKRVGAVKGIFAAMGIDPMEAAGLKPKAGETVQ